MKQLLEIAHSVWIDPEKIGAVIHTAEIKGQTRMVDTIVLSETGQELYHHHTERSIADRGPENMRAIRYANLTHETILARLGLKHDESIEPQINDEDL